MTIIKLDAIDSTNDYLKELSKNQYVENFTAVVARSQTNGKGQMGAKWVSQEGKNLTASILVNNILTNNQHIFYLNMAVALAVTSVLIEMNLPKISIKWPNDIMSDTKKLGGILIENSIKSDGTINSIVGIGLNVNQTDFSELPKATSVVLQINQEIDLHILLKNIVHELKHYVSVLLIDPNSIREKYHDNLFKKGIPMAFQNTEGNNFMGIIQQVSNDGKLELLLEDDSLAYFGIKEIQMLF